MRLYTLPDSELALYEAAEDGTLGALVWSNDCKEDVRVQEQFDEYPFKATGVPDVEIRHVGQHHEISFSGLFDAAMRLVENQKFALVVTFGEAGLETGAGHYIRRIYYNVTSATREIAAREANEFGGGITLKSPYYIETEGEGTPPTPT